MNDQELIECKKLLRQKMKNVRKNLPGRDAASSEILKQVSKQFLTTFKTVCVFVSKEPEVETNQWIQSELKKNFHTIVVPYCDGPVLKLYRLENWDWLQPSKFGLLETAEEFRKEHYLVCPGDVDLFLVPGLAFDRNGNRLGYGKGFYDQLLAQKKPGSPSVALAFRQQIIDQVPSKRNWDQKMNYVQTDKELINCR